MTAVDVDALDKLREAVAQWLAARDSQDGILSSWHEDADALLAGPFEPLIAEVRRGRALREAVEGLAEEMHAEGTDWFWRDELNQGEAAGALHDYVERLRAAVDGGEQ